jgi:glycosyltransferase involved in cell wall biosynthesis
VLDRPSVSVVVNNYNYGRFLQAAIDSALAQAYPLTEVVVVDDGSTDDSREVIASYGSRIVPVLKANGGQGSAFNAGFLASRGDLVVFLDSDDMLGPDVAARVAAAWRPGVAKVQYRLQVIDEAGRPRQVFKPAAGDPMPNGDVRWQVLTEFGYTAPPTSGNAFSRSALAAVLPLPEEECRSDADENLHALAALQGEVVSIPEPLAYYRVHGSNSWTDFRPSFEERLAGEVVRALQREERIRQAAARLGLEAAPHLMLRSVYFATLRTVLRIYDAERYPVREDSAAWLTWRTLGSIWRRRPRGGGATAFRSGVRLALRAAWLVGLLVMPRPIARRVARTTLVHRRRMLHAG